LSDVIAIDPDDIAFTKELWTMMEATDWRWPPDVLLRQDDRILHNLLTFSAEAARIRKSLADKEK
jgi:hypothetical protein